MIDDIQLWLSMEYQWIKAIHIISIIAWMAGLLYLPRLFVYHAEAFEKADDGAAPSVQAVSETFKVMERRLYTIIMRPAMIVSWILGLLMIWGNPAIMQGGWMHTKLTAVVLLTGVHHMLGAYIKRFVRDENTKSSRFYRIMNEVPTVLMIIIVIMAVVEPF